jgi:hypothetical protein
MQLKNAQIQDIAKSTNLFVVIRNIFLFVIIQRDNIFAKFYLDLRFYNCY